MLPRHDDALGLRGAHPAAVVGLKGGAFDQEDAALEQRGFLQVQHPEGASEMAPGGR